MFEEKTQDIDNIFCLKTKTQKTQVHNIVPNFKALIFSQNLENKN